MDRSFRVVASAVVEGEPDRPYAPGYLAFREGQLTLAALTALDVEPELVFLDGHGVVHERGLGMASHVGVLLGLPTIGVPKTPFHAIDHDPGPNRGDYYVLTKEWGAQGASIRLKAGVKPVYVSPGQSGGPGQRYRTRAGVVERAPPRTRTARRCAHHVGPREEPLSSTSAGTDGRERQTAMKLEKDTELYLLNSIKRFFGEEMEMEIGDLKAAMILDFFVGEMGPSIYNQAIADAQAYFTDKVADLAGVHNEAEFDYWKKR